MNRLQATILISLAILYGMLSPTTALVHSNAASNGPAFVTPRRPLPAKVIVGYATDCDDKAKHAIRQGVNVLIWAFLGLHKNAKDGNNDGIPTLEGSLDLDCIRTFIQDMDQEGYSDTVHLVSFGGWNGPHVDPSFRTAEEWFQAWKFVGGSIFHGMDWDPEGNDDLQSKWNYFSKDTLDMIGKISRMAKQEGYIVAMAPAQSYLDIQSSNFSRYVNLTDSTRTWHGDFHYFGANVYAYILAKYGDYIDFVSIQFYESYSRAGLEIKHHKMAPEAYLSLYVQQLASKGQQFFVDFEQDKESGLKSQNVALPLSKLVLGFTNVKLDGGNSDKMVFFPPECIQAAYEDMVDWQMTPRGFMYWVIGHDGVNGMDYAKDLNDILHVRSTSTDQQQQQSSVENQ